jgi:hypothetical protein
MSGRQGRFYNVFPDVADTLGKSGTAIPSFIVFNVLILIALWLMAEDFSTSVWGYELLPVNQAFRHTKYFVAALPIVAQMAMAYLAIGFAMSRHGRSYIWYAVGGFLIFWVIDSVPDIVFRSSNGQNPFVAILLTVFVFTIATEIILTVFLAMNRSLWKHFVVDVKKLAGETSSRINRGIDRSVDTIGDMIHHPDYGNVSTTQHNRGRGKKRK